ncbi:MAG: hypothetical protein AB7L91_03105 [Dehalococcoidia bacterium]
MADEHEIAIVDDDGEEPSAEALAELAAVSEAEAASASSIESALEETRRELEEQRRLALTAVARYREAALAAEPELPPELVGGETVEAVDASLAAARRTVASIRQRLAEEAEPSTRGFPAGAPARLGVGSEGLTAAEKIARGLEQRAGHARSG